MRKPVFRLPRIKNRRRAAGWAQNIIILVLVVSAVVLISGRAGFGSDSQGNRFQAPAQDGDGGRNYGAAAEPMCVMVTPEDGVITVALNRLATVTLVGFVNPGTPEGGGVPWLVIVLIVVGVLLLGGAGVLVYFFLIRKPKEEDDPDGDGPDDGNPEGEGPDGDRPDGPQDPDGEEPPEDGLPEDAVSEDNGWASGEEMNSDGTDGNTRVIPNVNGAASPVSDATQVIGGVSLGAFAERPANDPSRPKR